jgi:hypothetical protein
MSHLVEALFERTPSRADGQAQRNGEFSRATHSSTTSGPGPRVRWPIQSPHSWPSESTSSELCFCRRKTRVFRGSTMEEMPASSAARAQAAQRHQRPHRRPRRESFGIRRRSLSCGPGNAGETSPPTDNRVDHRIGPPLPRLSSEIRPGLTRRGAAVRRFPPVRCLPSKWIGEQVAAAWIPRGPHSCAWAAPRRRASARLAIARAAQRDRRRDGTLPTRRRRLAIVRHVAIA